MDFNTTIQALKNNNELCNLLAEGKKSIYHLKSKDAGTYPILILSIISDVPESVSDNKEILHRITLRIHIVTENGAYTNIYRKLNNIMNELGYNRRQTTELIDDDLYIKVCDYTIVTDVTEV